MIRQHGKMGADDDDVEGWRGCEIEVKSINLMWPASQPWQIGLSLLYQAFIVFCVCAFVFGRRATSTSGGARVAYTFIRLPVRDSATQRMPWTSKLIELTTALLKQSVSSASDGLAHRSLMQPHCTEEKETHMCKVSQAKTPSQSDPLRDTPPSLPHSLSASHTHTHTHWFYFTLKLF